MDYAHTVFRDAAASHQLRGDAPRSRVWESSGWAINSNKTNLVIELPLFTLAPRWFEYYAYIGVGSPPQYMRVVLDTMASDLSLLGYGHSRHEMYDHAKSNSYVANNTLVRTALPGTDETALGVLSKDHVTLNQELRLRNQTFTELLDRAETNAYFESTLADGWLGLGRSRVQEAFPVASLIDRMIHGQLVREPVVGIHLNPLTTGLVSFGGVNAKRFDGELSYIEVTPLTSEYLSSSTANTYWSFRVDAVLINGEPVRTTKGDEYYGGSAVLDAVLPRIRGPREIVDAINAALGQDTAMRVPCASSSGAAPVTVTLLLGGKPFTMKREDLVVSAQNGPGCVSLLASSTSSTSPQLADWSIGAPFMQAFYTALDFGDKRTPRIGFARSKRETPPGFSAYDTLWLVLLAIVLLLIMRSLGRQKTHRPPAPLKNSLE